MLTGHSVYLIHAKGSRYFKIGTTTKDVKWRVCQIQGCCPMGLNILLELKSSMALEIEQDFKREFAEHRVHGEWFSLSKVNSDKAIKFLNNYGG